MGLLDKFKQILGSFLGQPASKEDKTKSSSLDATRPYRPRQRDDRYRNPRSRQGGQREARRSRGGRRYDNRSSSSRPQQRDQQQQRPPRPQGSRRGGEGRFRNQRRPQRPFRRPSQGQPQAQAPRPPVDITQLEKVGQVTHFFFKVNAAAIRVDAASLSVGDGLYFKGPRTDFKMKIHSMQINRVPVSMAQKGSEIGILVRRRVQEGDEVYRLP